MLGEATIAIEKNITAYCEPWSLRAGEKIVLKASSSHEISATLDLVRITCGDPGSKGPGRIEDVVASELPAQLMLKHQPLTPGSYGQVDIAGLTLKSGLHLALHLYATRATEDQALLTLGTNNGDAFVLRLHDGYLTFDTPAGAVRPREARLRERRWYALKLSVSFADGIIRSSLAALPSRSPGRDIAEPAEAVETTHKVDAIPAQVPQTLYFARDSEGHFFDGRLARPTLELDALGLSWDFSADIGGKILVESSAHKRHGVLHQLPARAVTGPAWDGSVQCWQHGLHHYDAVHFHSDDLYDADWQESARVTLPSNLPSGIYAFRITAADEVDRVPFFVRPAVDAATSDVALLMPSFTYLAYANHRMLFEGADFVAARNSLSPEHNYIRDHREVAPSCYEKHVDGSGVMFSSRLRPILQMRPGADRWNFTPDTCLNAFMTHLDVGHDVLSDDAVHEDGVAALAPYRVIVTGTHPEYWSTEMLDALEQWQRSGGRLIYLGGNGFYWRVACNDAWPGALELRRTEDGVRNWQTEPGESYHAFNGEYGGLWRRLARAPNQLVGVGYTAQGFERATAYEKQAGALDARAAWIFDGVPDDWIGTSGLGGGAAGQEIDRVDLALGSPEHTLILATATDFGPDMVRTKEEFEAAVFIHADDPRVCADMVFFETAGGGAVFSVGSIAWFGALARENYNNDVARITANVLKRFADPKPFEAPQAGA